MPRSRLSAHALAVLGALVVALSASAGCERRSASGPERPAPAARTFVDAAGRTVALPPTVRRVFAAGHPAGVLVYTLAPDTLVGWTRPLPERARAYVPERFFALPALGRLTGRGGTANVESVLAAKPDLIVDYGSVGPTYASLADRVQEQTGIPYVLLDGRFEELPRAYRQLGEVLGAAERAERLASYAEGVVAEMRAVAARAPRDRAPRVYYARGTDGLETGRGRAINVELLEFVGARNVASEGAGESARNLARVSPEALLAWDPDVILTVDPRVRDTVRRDELWRALGAVRAGRVHLAPDLPFGWFDRPPSANRLIGVRWLIALLYPELARGDLRAETRRFYALFYHHELDDAQLDELLSGALPEAP